MGELKPCGTPAAWRRHKRHGEEPCAACREAHSAEVAKYKRRGPVGPRELLPCGTEAAARRHRRRGEPLCFPCRVAHANYVRPYMQASRARKRAA